MALRRAAQDAVLGALDATIFSRYAFEATFNQEDGALIRLVYKDRDGFAFKAFYEPDDDESPWVITEAPGQHLMEPSTSRCDSFEECLSKIEAWIGRIFEELAESSPSEAVGALRDAFERRLDEISEPDAPFSAGEAEQWSDRLDQMADQIEKLHEEQNIQKQDLWALRREFDRLKAAGTTMPKKAWLRAVGSKLFDYVDKKADLALKTAIEAAVKQTMIGPGSS